MIFYIGSFKIEFGKYGHSNRYKAYQFGIYWIPAWHQIRFSLGVYYLEIWRKRENPPKFNQ